MTKKTEKQTKKPLSKRMTKTLQVMEALGREEGVTIDELTKMTGWQAHTVRGHLSILKKAGAEIIRERVDGARYYRISLS